MKTERVYVLGAGCSASYGYPLAKDFLGELRRYGGAVSSRPNAERLRNSVWGTVALMEKHHTPTIDRLTRRLYLERDRGASGSSEAQIRENLVSYRDQVLDAKIVTVAMFLDREANARTTGLLGYEDFLGAAFEGNRDPAALKTTPARVLSFNYDRLFEMALADYFGLGSSLDLYAEGVRNPGASRLSAEDGFRFLKLHGTVGMRVTLKPTGPNYDVYTMLENASLVIDDDLFWRPGSKTAVNRGEHGDPLIVFPHEKEIMRERETSHVCATYLDDTWREAEKLVQETKQIWVVGYSFDPNDRKSMMDLLRRKTPTCDIIVQNPVAEAICNELRLRYPDLADSIRPLANPF
jgi:hypothetical protein